MVGLSHIRRAAAAPLYVLAIGAALVTAIVTAISDLLEDTWRLASGVQR